MTSHVAEMLIDTLSKPPGRRSETEVAAPIAWLRRKVKILANAAQMNY